MTYNKDPTIKHSATVAEYEDEDYTFSQSQYEDYLTLSGIVNRTGISKDDVYILLIKELLDNAVDAAEKSVYPLVEVDYSVHGQKLHIIVRNLNESNKIVFSKAKLESIFNLTKFTSTKRGLFKVSRGALGDALKYVLGIPYALSKELGITVDYTPLTIRTNQRIFDIKLNVDKGVVREQKQEQEQQQQRLNWTEVEVRLPIVEGYLNFNEIETFLREYVLFSTHVSFKFTLPTGRQMSFPQIQQINKKWMNGNNSSGYYYTQQELDSFVDKFDDNNAKVYDVIKRLFREGSSMKKAAFDDITMGELKKSPTLKKKLLQEMRNIILTPPQKLLLPFDSSYKVRPEALKQRLEQWAGGAYSISSMKYKSKHAVYSSDYNDDGVSFPFFAEVAVFHSEDMFRWAIVRDRLNFFMFFLVLKYNNIFYLAPAIIESSYVSVSCLLTAITIIYYLDSHILKQDCQRYL